VPKLPISFPIVKLDAKNPLTYRNYGLFCFTHGKVMRQLLLMWCWFYDANEFDECQENDKVAI
jgi:hypothetical protein